MATNFDMTEMTALLSFPSLSDYNQYQEDSSYSPYALCVVTENNRYNIYYNGQRVTDILVSNSVPGSGSPNNKLYLVPSKIEGTNTVTHYVAYYRNSNGTNISVGVTIPSLPASDDGVYLLAATKSGSNVTYGWVDASTL